MRHERLGSIASVLGNLALLPVAALAIFGTRHFMPPMWFHFYGVGVTALVATAAAVALTMVGARLGDPRTVVVGGGFSLMAALLAVHGLVTPGVLVGPNGLIAVTGAATLPVGGVVLALSTLPIFITPRAIPRVIAIQASLAVAIIVLSLVGVLRPDLVPSVPAARSTAAWIVLALGLAAYGFLAVHAARTFLLTRRVADLAVVMGLLLLAAALYGALALTFMDLGWWIGHLFEVLGIGLVGASLAYDLRRGRRSRALVGDLRAREIVSSEEAFLGARVRALTVRLAAKDTSTEEHTRRVALLAVEIGEVLGLAAPSLRSLAIGGLLHDIGKLSIPDAILQKPGALDDHEFAVIKLHPERGRDLLNELGGFDESVKRLVLDHHERLDGSGYPRGLTADALDLSTRILAVCDVYDALVSPRVYRDAWPQARALALLQEESGTSFDPRCVAALVRVLHGETKARAELASDEPLAQLG
ncbi:MAG TPA: HD-GYP domain-containing protein [Gaiellaceae bacterium]|jgi:HD-GYP domain-containing protein (c-di-GMP phosphodiesterase class II)